MVNARCLLWLGLGLWALSATGTPPAPPTTTAPGSYRVFVKVQGKTDAKPRLLHAADIARPTGGAAPVISGQPVPELDGLGVAFQAAWLAHLTNPPATVTFTETMMSDTGMKPTPIPVKVSFTVKDALYWPAVLRSFLEKNGYDGGLGHLAWVDYDRSAESPAGADDRASTHSNFRAGKTDPYGDSGEAFFVIKKAVRPSGMGTPSGVLRTSTSKPTLAVSQNFDDGTFAIAYVRLYRDGRSEVTPRTVADDVRAAIGSSDDDVSVNLIENGRDYQTRVVKKGAPKHFEAHVVQELEHRAFYVTDPAIDPAGF